MNLNFYTEVRLTIRIIHVQHYKQLVNSDKQKQKDKNQLQSCYQRTISVNALVNTSKLIFLCVEIVRDRDVGFNYTDYTVMYFPPEIL